MRCKLIILILIFFISIGVVSAGNNTTIVDNPIEYYTTNTNTVTALESGDSNISFTDNYKGYCIEWGEHSAEINDTFFVDDFKVYNKETGEDVSNYIKTFFVYFYNDTQKNPILTQHMIWKFTDNKEFSQFKANKELYYAILNKSKEVQIPNQGVLKINNKTQMVFSFKIFHAKYIEYQNYMGFRIYFENITNQINNNTINNSNTSQKQHPNNQSKIKINKTSNIKSKVNSNQYINKFKKT